MTLFVATTLSLGLLEGGVRLLNRSLGHYPRKDPILHHSLQPRARLQRTNAEFDVVYEINSYGMRDREFSIEKPPGTVRILMLGDSYTFGIGNNLDDTFSKQLERKLNESGEGRRFEVINGGCSSYSPLLEYLLLVQKGLALNPDLVILNYDISDVQDDYKYGRIAEFDGEGRPVRVPPVEVQWFYRDPRAKYRAPIALLEHSELYQFVMKRFYQWRGERNPPLLYEKAKAVEGDIEYDRDLPMRDGVGDWKTYFDVSARYLKMIRDLLRSKGIGFLVTSYPYGNLVSASEWSIGRRLRGFDDKVYSTRLFGYLKEWSSREGVDYLDMEPFFRSSTDFPLFYPYDGHFTPAGHRVAAEALYGFLRDKDRKLVNW